MKIKDIAKIEPVDLSLRAADRKCINADGEEMNPGFCDEGKYDDNDHRTQEQVCEHCDLCWPLFDTTRKEADRKQIYVTAEDQMITTKDGKTYIAIEVDVSEPIAVRTKKMKEIFDELVADIKSGKIKILEKGDKKNVL